MTLFLPHTVLYYFHHLSSAWMLMTMLPFPQAVLKIQNPISEWMRSLLHHHFAFAWFDSEETFMKRGLKSILGLRRIVSWWKYRQSGPVHNYTTPEEFENGDLLQKTHLMFSVHTALEEIPLSCHRFEKLRFQNVIRPHKNGKLAFSISSGLKGVFEKLRFSDGLVWTEGQTVQI